MVRMVSWNINATLAPLDDLMDMEVDVALLQEVPVGGWRKLAELGGVVAVTPHEPWLPWPPRTYDRWPLVVGLSDRVRMEWFSYRFPTHFNSQADRIEVSGVGTLAVARVIPLDGGQSFIAASMYARWQAPHPSAGDQTWVAPDAAAHRSISDLSVFVSPRSGSEPRIVVAGDFNMGFVGEFEKNTRYRSIYDRMNALGLEYLGPRSGDEIAPTYRRPSPPAGEADTQMDHVFASSGLHVGATVSAMNGADEWGPSDHCRIVIEL